MHDPRRPNVIGGAVCKIVADASPMRCFVSQLPTCTFRRDLPKELNCARLARISSKCRAERMCRR